MKKGRRVTFSPVIQSTMEEVDLLTTDQDETTADSPMIPIIEETEQTKAQETKPESTVPPPGFRPFQWPQAEWEQKGDATLDPGLNFVASWSARIMEERSSTPPSHTALADPPSGCLPGFYCGASGFAGDRKIQTDGSRPDSISAPATTTPTDESRDKM